MANPLSATLAMTGKAAEAVAQSFGLISKGLISKNTGDAGPTPAFTPYATRLLPKDLLVSARKFSKEEADKAILDEVKKKKVSPSPVFNPMIGSTTSGWPVMYSTTMLSSGTTMWGNSSTLTF